MLDIAIITARGGSMGLPGKNISPLGGVPMIEWTVRAALSSGVFTRVIVSTDCADIASAARAANCEVPFMRPEELASSTATSADVVSHALNELDIAGEFALLQPTSPFRSAHHIAEAAAQYGSSGADGLVSTCEGKPVSWAYVRGDEELIVPAVSGAQAVTRRQDSAQIEYPNGAIYLGNAAHFDQTRQLIPQRCASYLMDPIDSLDIDTQADFDLACAVVKAGMRAIDV